MHSQIIMSKQMLVSCYTILLQMKVYLTLEWTFQPKRSIQLYESYIHTMWFIDNLFFACFHEMPFPVSNFIYFKPLSKCFVLFIDHSNKYFSTFIRIYCQCISSKVVDVILGNIGRLNWKCISILIHFEFNPFYLDSNSLNEQIARYNNKNIWPYH